MPDTSDNGSGDGGATYAQQVRTPAVARLALALVVSVLAGVALAGLAFPLVGGAGLVAQAGAQTFLDLPQKLTATALPQRTRILDRNGHLVATLFLQNRVPVRIADVPRSVQSALIAIEDSRFYEHNGLDVKGTLRALARNSSSGSVQQGGSTLTQQYVKNVLLEAAHGRQAGQDAARERSVRRKLQEARYALQLEKTMSKAKILEGYLNIAYFGNGAYGIGTAASHYFSRPVQRLSLAQGALLAGMVQNPTRFDPQVHPRAARARRNTVLSRMHELGRLGDAAYQRALHEPLRLAVTSTRSGCEAPGVRAPFFCDYVRRYLEEGPVRNALGATLAERQDLLLAGGLTIRTTLDPVVQVAAQTAVDARVPPGDPSGVVSVVDTVEPGTGAVRAMAVDRAYGDKRGQTKVNFALGGSLGFHAGSTFKAFVLARALQMGIPLSTTIDSPQRYESKVFSNCRGGQGCGPYTITNAGDSEAGTFDLPTATWLSVNTYYLQLEERTGVAAPAALAESLGVHSLVNGRDDQPLVRGGSFVLGSSGVSPLDMAAAYAAFAAHGNFCPPRPVTSITRADGHPLALPGAPCRQALEAGVADTVTSVLRGVIDGPNAFRTGRGASIGRPAAGKTGTENDSKAAWFVGYTPQLATAVWLGKPTPTPLVGATINGQYFRHGVFGGDIPASIWQQTMAQALQGVPVTPFTGADGAFLSGQQVVVPDLTGQPVDVATQALRDLGFSVTVGYRVRAGPIPYGAVARTYPRAGSSVSPGSTVTIIPSNGKFYVAPAPTSAPPAVPSATSAPVATTAPPTPPPAPAPQPKPQPSKKRH